MSQVTLPLKLRAHAHESGGKLHREVHLKDDIIIENKNIVIIINDNIANKDTAFLQSPGKLLKSDLCSSPLFKEPAPQLSTLSTASPGKDS